MNWDFSSNKEKEKIIHLSKIQIPKDKNELLIYIATNIESYSTKNKMLEKLYIHFKSNNQYNLSLKCIDSIESYSIKNKLSIDLYNHTHSNRQITVPLKSLLLNESYSDKNKYLELLLNQVIEKKIEVNKKRLVLINIIFIQYLVNDPTTATITPGSQAALRRHWPTANAAFT